MAFLWDFFRKFYAKRETGNQDEKGAVEKADELFGKQKYEEVRGVLGASKLDRNIEVLWRLARTLYKIAEQEPPATREKYLKDAYEVLNKAMRFKETDPNVHKWMAIIISALNENQKKPTENIKNLELEKMHLQRSLELNPNDYAVLYMLGNWCFTVSSMTNLQRALIGFFFSPPPKSTYEEAYQYFLKAEELKGKYYIPNVYMLGKACYLMNHYYKANYYFDLATSLTPHTPFEKKCQEEAKEMNKKLETFKMPEGIFNDFSS